MSLPPPESLGLPASFTKWRPGQVDAVLRAIDAEQRFKGLVLPTGFGKSLVYMAVAWLTGKRAVVLTSTKALQRQLMRDFSRLAGTAIVQGQRAYLCQALEPGGELYFQFAHGEARRQTMADHGPCHLGVDCSLKLGGCRYYDALRDAGAAQIVVTNYAFWLNLQSRPVVSLHPDLLVCDEAHAAPDALADALGCTVSPETLGQVLNEKLLGATGRDADQWVAWARDRAIKLTALTDGTHPTTRDAVIKVRRAQTLLYALRRLAQINPRLLLISEVADGIRFDVVWAGSYAEEWLWRRAGSVVLTSATMTRHTADLLGIMEKDLALYEAGDGFPLTARPVYLSPACRPPFGLPLQVDHRMTADMEVAWLKHVDTILAGRRDRKGIIHTVSYRRRDAIIARSAHRDRMMTHGRHDTLTQIQRFKAAAPGTILVSPAVTTGYDFPYRECEYQIVAKIPFPDGRDPVTKARTLIDPRYPAHLAMQELVQAVGRGMRASDDQCETFIVDAHAYWFLSKHADLAPRWFRRAIHKLTAGSVPAPPAPLTTAVSPARDEE